LQHAGAFAPRVRVGSRNAAGTLTVERRRVRDAWAHALEACPLH